MISLDKNFLFIHIPKTGGNSLQNILINYSEDIIVVQGKHRDGIERFEIRNNKYDIKKHSTLSQYKAVIEPNKYDKLFKFAVIRNPWDRMISYYFSPHRDINKWDRDDFIKLVNDVHPICHYISEQLHFERVTNKFRIRFFQMANKKAVDEDIDFLMRFENIDDDFRLLCQKIDIPYSPLPIRNKSNRKHYSHYYDEELIEIVRTKFAKEICYGKYQFKKA